MLAITIDVRKDEQPACSYVSTLMSWRMLLFVLNKTIKKRNDGIPSAVISAITFICDLASGGGKGGSVHMTP